jgi:hypothetical protein
MQRCVPQALAGTFAAAVLLCAALPAQGQMQRSFPATALRGELRITQPPDALLNGQPVRLAPGTRIRDQRNLLALSATLVGQPLPVHYTLDPGGLLMDIWVLTPTEQARKPWPETPAQARGWQFNPSTQTWSRP